LRSAWYGRRSDIHCTYFTSFIACGANQQFLFAHFSFAHLNSLYQSVG
jgi:hypothetical protein